MMWVVAFLALGAGAAATTYYINDGSTVGDVYCTQLGNNANNGRTPSTPKLTLNNLLASTNLLPGDVVLIDTGTYPTNVVIGTNVVGAAGNRIVFQGSTNLAAGGTILTAGSGNVLEIRGRHLEFRDIQIAGGTVGIGLNGASFNEFFRINAISNSANGVKTFGPNNDSNAFRRCVFYSLSFGAMDFQTTSFGNYIEHTILGSQNGISIFPKLDSFSNIVNSILFAPRILSTAGNIPRRMENNVFSYTTVFGTDHETLEDVQRVYTNWVGNTVVADPKFVNAEGFDFHLLSAAGFVSNGVWVTNATVGYSPGIDFGARE
jgi:hypothetical protein